MMTFFCSKGFFNPQHIEDLLKESKRMFHLNHPNVQPMIGVCIDGGPIPFVVMPYMQNGSLLSFLRKNKDTLLLTQGEEDEVCVSVCVCLHACLHACVCLCVCKCFIVAY